MSQLNIHRNYNFIREWFSLKSNDIKNDFIHAIDEILEVVVICVDKVSEAFQLFDSQNTRGKALDPHDLLKAYHLREMKKYPYEMELNVYSNTRYDMEEECLAAPMMAKCAEIDIEPDDIDVSDTATFVWEIK